jgi:hypothetical protein
VAEVPAYQRRINAIELNRLPGGDDYGDCKLINGSNGKNLMLCHDFRHAPIAIPAPS